MSRAPRTLGRPTAPLPARGQRVVLDGLPGGPWTTVVEHEAGGVLALAPPPRLGGRPAPLPLDWPFIVTYTWREVPCEVDALLVRGPAAGGEGHYEARTSGPPRRLQRRGAVRVPVALIAHARLGDDIDATRLGAVTENLSAGGALLRLASAITVGTRLSMVIHCGGAAGDLDLAATVARSDRIDDGECPWRIAVTFAGMTSAEEDRLVRFVFERQRELRSREAGPA